MLIAMLALFGTLVGIMLIIWLTSRVFASQTAVPVELEEIGTTEEGSLGGSMELDSPDMEEPLEDVEPAETLAAVADAVASKLSMLDRARRGSGSGSGGGGGRRGKPRRWEVRFPEGLTTKAYGRMLDSFGIEMGVIEPGGNVAYAKNFGGPNPTIRTGPREAEKRYYLTWRRGNLRAADEELLMRAGISAKGKIILKFLPRELELHLIQLKNTKAGARKNKIYKTVFGVTSDGSKYKFYVLSQQYK